MIWAYRESSSLNRVAGRSLVRVRKCRQVHEMKRDRKAALLVALTSLIDLVWSLISSSQGRYEAGKIFGLWQFVLGRETRIVQVHRCCGFKTAWLQCQGIS